MGYFSTPFPPRVRERKGYITNTIHHSPKIANTLCYVKFIRHSSTIEHKNEMMKIVFGRSSFRLRSTHVNVFDGSTIGDSELLDEHAQILDAKVDILARDLQVVSEEGPEAAELSHGEVVGERE